MSDSGTARRVGSWRRARFLATLGGTLGAGLTVGGRAVAAQYNYKLGHPFPVDYAPHVRLVQMAKTINQETGGRLDIQIFPNATLGSQTAMLTQVRLGSIQLLTVGNPTYTGLVPAAAIDSVGFAFPSDPVALKAMDGALGAYVRREFAAKGLYAFDRLLNFSFRQVTAWSKAIRTPEDFVGFKVRATPGAIVVDLFKTLGASPTPIDANELYTALQTHLVDGQETPLVAIQGYRFYEVQKYLSLTNHIWTGAWVVANTDAWNSLPADIRDTVERNMRKYADLERRDVAVQNVSVADKLRREGLTFNNTDGPAMRAKLGPYYTKWKGELGSTGWNLLEATVGKLGP